MATSRKGGQKAGGDTASKKGKLQMSPKNQGFYALNDLLTLHADDTETPEVIQARRVLKDNGFDERPSRAQEVKRIEEKIKAVDVTAPGASAEMIELGKALSAAQRGKIQAAKK